MHPVLFHVLHFPIHSYGFMLMLSFLFGIWIASSLAKKRGLDPNVIADLGFWLIISAIVGARAYYVILHSEEFRGDPLSMINPFHNGLVGIGGLVMYGGFIGALIASIIYFSITKRKFADYADVVAPTFGLGVALTRIGCFMNGCCYGASSTHCAVSFPMESAAGMYQHEIHATGLYPSQLYESAGGLVIFAVVMLIGNRKPFTGFLFYLAGLMYSVLRFCVDFSRFYGTDERIAGFSHNQIVCLIMFVIFGGLIVRGLLFKNELSESPAAPIAQPAETSKSDSEK
jgi:phosphatidylglycerol---prolipoprotein diacylglyceryl transferase